MVTFASSHRPPDVVVLHMTKSDSSITSCTQRGSFSFIHAKSNSQKKTKASAKTNIPLPSLVGPYVYYVHSNDSTHNGASPFHKRTHGIKILVVVTSNALLAMDILLDTVGGPNIINKDFLQQAWKEFMK